MCESWHSKLYLESKFSEIERYWKIGSENSKGLRSWRASIRNVSSETETKSSHIHTSVFTVLEGHFGLAVTVLFVRR